MDFSFFSHMNILREDPEQFIEDNTDEFEFHPTALYDLANYEEDLEPLKWNRALANTARHLVNDMGACGTTGDVNSDQFPDILRKYYAHSFEDLEYHIFEHRPYGFDNDF